MHVPSQTIKSIQGWRVFFTIFVVALHLRLTESYSLAAAAVSFFLILSGFLSAHSDTSSIKKFYIKKGKKFYFIHWVALLLLAPMYFLLPKYQTTDFVLRYLFNATLLQPFLPPNCLLSSANGPTLNGPSWFLSILLLFFLLLPFIKKIRQKSKKLFYGLVIFWGIISVVVPYMIDTNRDWYIYFCPPIRMFECLLGLCLADVKSITKQLGTKEECLVVIILLMALLASVYLPLPYGVQVSYLWIPVLLLLIWIFSQSYGIISKWLSTKSMVWLGNISFEFYMFHWVMKRFIIAVEQFLHVEFPTLLFAFLVILCTFVIAIIYHYWLEKKILNKYRRID